ncbi:tripartite tricarboxylate transporter substrate binding protein [Cupriavidus basilensis]|uniref:tripartite tricarboxylate transporter substrate binding protein n=1 Tax=Cupriavidus basilensis TaxID=68895 RepID=UPI0020A6B591|nr:tripartite tricarboxylate transporter substrate binding protein [Cupriavidus basilensis]MCP3019472.1 tripartite tricarboxylate transporter substrate binding protein [Cupriavidus basilensis]
MHIHTKPIARALAGIAAALALAAPATHAAEASYPTKTITIVVPASPGGAIDLVARLVGQKMTEAWGQSVVVDNRPGATGIIGTDLVAKSAPDGYMLALVASSHAINPSMVKKLPFDTIKSFEPVALTHVVPLMLVVSPSLPVTSVKELIAYGKANPGKLSFASSGSGGAPHFSGELFKSMTGIDMVHIPYKGSTLAHPDLTSGRVSLMFDTVAAIGPQVKGGKVRPLAVTTAKRSSAAPQVPTMAQAGLPGYETSTWGGVLAPAGTPKAVVDKLNAEINKALASPDVRERLQNAGIEPAGGTPAQFASFLQVEMGKWAKVAKDAGIQPE